MREGMEEREAATATERNAVKRSEEAGAAAELWNARPEAQRRGTPKFSILLAKYLKKFQNDALCLNLS